MQFTSIFLGLLVFGFNYAAAADAASASVGHLSLAEFVNQVVSGNPELKAFSKEQQSQESLVYERSWLESPMVGISRMTGNMPMGMGTGGSTDYLMISQRIKFPVKYYLGYKQQKQMAKAAESSYDVARVKKAAQAKALYYSIYSLQKVVELTSANISNIKEFARVAERRYASGQEVQHNSMKAHVELTRLEIALLRLREKEELLRNKAQALVGGVPVSFNFSGASLKRPQLTSKKWQEISKGEVSDQVPELRVAAFQKEAAFTNRSLKRWEFAPDFQISMEQAISGSSLDNSIASIRMTIPLWFWTEGKAASAATAKAAKAEYLYNERTNQVRAELKDLVFSVTNKNKVLEIYETSLIPQAQTAHRLAGAAYRSSRGSLLSFIDSEQAYYEVQSEYYRELEAFATALADLEALTGIVLVDWERNLK